MKLDRRIVWTAAVAAILTLALTALLVSIIERKQEARHTFFRVAEIDEDTEDPAVWGRNFPLQYDSWKRTVDMVRTRYGGSEAMPRNPTAADPRERVSQEKIEEDPRLKRMWLGFPFAVDHREDRGHAYMLIDARYTKRVLEFNQPGTCLNCHASTAVLYRRLGGGDIFKGFEALNSMPFVEAVKYATHPVACVDCHDPQTMRLRITRPAFIEGIRMLKAAQGVPNYDPNTMASAQEMRTFVCAQCHVEYYFQGPQKRLVYPWSKGLRAEQMFAHYEDAAHRDWVHTETGAPLLKAQHPEFEMFSLGIHARAGVACADCHMPYKREGGMKVSDHHVRSPLLNINRACQGCHRFSEQEIKDRVEEIQSRFMEARNIALDALIDLIEEISRARALGLADAQLAPARQAQRKAQFFIDLVEAENSIGFHAPGEMLRLLTQALDIIRKGQVALREARPLRATAASP